tara:strand:- start:2229 stop:2966 length:738 start_codon:yes stop_codon:yes gene_type:complete
MNVPGFSTYQRLNEAFIDKVAYWILLASVAIGFLVAEILRYWMNAKISVTAVFIVCIVVVGLSAYRIWRNISQIKAIKLGWKGEVATGQLLESLRNSGFVVLHDVQTDNHGNIDHVVIGPSGIFAIETKTISMPVDDKAVIQVGQDDQLIIDNQNVNYFKGRHPLNQTRTSAELLSQMIWDSAGRKMQVIPVLVYPGWWVNENPNCDVMVLNPKRFVTLVHSMPTCLSDADIRTIENNLIRVLRA